MMFPGGLIAIIDTMIMLIPALFSGWVVGIIVNYFADTLPIKRRFSLPFCSQCDAVQKWSRYLIWPRKCQQCQKPRSNRTFIIEIIFALVGIYLWVIPVRQLNFFPSLILAAYLGIVTVIDIEHRLIMHPVSVFGILLGIICGINLHGLKSTLTGGAAGYAFMLLIYIAGIGYIRVLACLGRPTDEVAMGFGDVNLSGVIGLLLGWPGIGTGLIFTILLSGLVSLGYILIMKIRNQYHSDLSLPFGPFLVGSAVILIFF